LGVTATPLPLPAKAHPGKEAGEHPSLSDFSREALTHLPSLMAVAKRLTRRTPEAEDLVQDTLLKAIRARDQYQPGTNLRAWLLKILRNTFISRYHRGQIERAALGTNFTDPVTDGWISSASIEAMRDPEAGLLRPQLEQEIQRALDELPEEFRVVVLLADAEGFAYREIAETLGCPIGTVMSRLHRARRILKTQLLHHAREIGLVAPETELGPNATGDDAGSTTTSDDAKNEVSPIDLRAYRRGRKSS
jgi:RNA polymerase sigma-70 factor (ECF subfamily)